MNLTPPNLIQELTNNLSTLQPKNETAQLITYALVASALVGIMVYHYIKEQERLPSLQGEKC